MNAKAIISFVVAFVLAMALSFLVHGMLLHDEYAKLPNLMRTQADAEQYFLYMLAAHVLIAFGLVWIYLKGKEDKPFLMQGIRFGIAVAVLSTIPIYLIYYAVMPFPPMLVLKQIVFDTIGVVLMGIVIAWINK